MNSKDMKVYVYSQGFMPRYWCWSCHGDEDHTMYRDYNFGSFIDEDIFKVANQF